MINTRVLELLKNPKNIQSEDLHLLKEEINSFPYIQNIRALHLYGVNLYDKENYQKALSSTAAYTTDKKILYQLINGKILPKIKAEPVVQEKQEVITEQLPVHEFVEEDAVVEDKNLNKETPLENEAKKFSDHDYEAASEGLIIDKPEINHLIINGERNRILFDGEENFLDEDNNETIDLESTLESGVIVTQKSVSVQDDLNKADVEEVIVAEELSETQVEEITDNAELNLEEIVSESDLDKTEETPEAPKSEVIIAEDAVDSEKIEEKITDEAEVSFQKIESFPAEELVSPENNGHSENQTEEITEVLNPELIIEEDKIESEQVVEKINDEAELSFHATDSFLPEVKIESHKTEEIPVSETPKSTINKHEDEMRRLIEEVEKRMKASKDNAPEKTEVADEIKEDEGNQDISFAETQAFHVGEEQKVAEEVVVKTAELIVEETLEEKTSEQTVDEVEDRSTEEPEIPVVSAWKPMSFETSRPDSVSAQPVEIPQPKEEIQEIEQVSKTENISEELPEEVATGKKLSEIKAAAVFDAEENDEHDDDNEDENEQVPVMNVSFFGSDIASLGKSFKSDQKEKEEAKAQETEITQQEIDDSNVPGFINTWQSWLKIDRVEEEIPVDKTEVKNKVIESFIENNPKISQLKDEVSFVVKEKTDDISHLMTETLANLYIEQKLYSKAVNAFLILSNKFPDKKEYFENKIQEIKDNRGKN